MAINLFKRNALPDTYYHFYEIFEDAPISDWTMYSLKEELYDQLCRLCEIDITEEWEEMEDAKLVEYSELLKEYI